MEELLRDKVSFVKADGKLVRSDIKAQVSAGSIFTFEVDLPIEPNDHFLRKLPNGLVEDYIVIDPNFISGFDDIPSSYQATVRRSDQQLGTSQAVIQNITNHFHGANSRMNVNSTDNSTNSTNDSRVFTDLRGAIATIDDYSARTRLLDDVASLEKLAGSGGFKQAYQNFISSAADHMTLIAPFIPALSLLL